MSDYIIVNGELYHHGVKGMKWGVRRAKRKQAKLDGEIKRRTERSKTIERDRADAKKRIDSAGYSVKKAARKKYNIDARYDYDKVRNDSRLARLKANKNSDYKNTDEYLRATTAYGKQKVDRLLYTRGGAIRIKSLENRGHTTRQARWRFAGEYALMSVGAAAVGTAIKYAASKYT